MTQVAGSLRVGGGHTTVDWDCAQFQLGVVVDHLQSGLFGARSTVTRASFRLGGCLHLS